MMAQWRRLRRDPRKTSQSAEKIPCQCADVQSIHFVNQLTNQKSGSAQPEQIEDRG
jgi:hypothetical protein